MGKQVLLLSLVVTLAACGGTTAPPAGRVAVTASGLLQASGVTGVTVTVASTGVVNQLAQDRVTGDWSGTVAAPAGLQRIAVRAWQDATLVGEGAADVDVVAGQEATAMVWVLDTGGPPPAADHGPIIVAITASAAALATGEVATVAVQAVDPDGDPMTYQWSQSCSAGAFANPFAAETGWWSAQPAACTLTVAVTSGAFTAHGSIDLAVEGPVVGGLVGVQATFVPNPYFDLIRVHGVSAPEPWPWYLDYQVSRTTTEAYGSSEFVTADATIPHVYYPGATQYLSLWLKNIPGLPDDDPALRVWLDDDCGGSATRTLWNFGGRDYGFINGNEVAFTWQTPLVAAVCLITAHVEYHGLADAFTVAAVLDGCVDDPFHGNTGPAAAAAISASWPRERATDPLPAELTKARTYAGLWANTADWYAFTPMAGVPTVSFVSPADPSLALAIYEADGTTLVASGAGSVGGTLEAGRPYLLKAGPGAAADSCGAAYDLEVWVGP